MAAVDLPASWTSRRLRRALNGLLGDDVWIESVQVVPDRFHPRYDAVARTYRYRLGLSPMVESPFQRRWCWPLGAEPDLALMDETSRALLGDHSFRAFAKAGQEERGDRCTVETVVWEPWDEFGVTFSITANRYLHHMVRYLVGTLVEVGFGRRPSDEVARLLEGTDPELTTSPPAPPQGLFLARVEYPAEAVHQPEPRATSA
jgi:tRNA pseudouridine38-40 synthase